MLAASLRQPRFLALWFTTLLSVFSLSVAWVTESWYAIKVLGRESDYGYILIAATVPRLIFMLAGGVLADRVAKSRLLTFSLSFRALLIALLGWLMLQDAASFGLLLAFAFCYGLLDACYWPARDALLPELVPEADLPQANSLLLVTSQLGMILGPVLAGGLLLLLPYGAVLLWQGVILLAAALLCYWQLGRRQMDAEIHAGARPSFRHELLEGLAYIRHHPQLSLLLLVFAFANVLFMGPLQQSIPLIVTRELGGDSHSYTTLLSGFGVGMTLGGLLMLRFAPRRHKFLFVMVMLMLESVLLALLAYTPGLWFVAANVVLIGICIACNNVPTMSMLQSYSERDKLGRVMGLNDTLSHGLTPLSYVIVTGLLALQVPHQAILLVAGGLMLLLCVAMLWRYPQIREIH